MDIEIAKSLLLTTMTAHLARTPFCLFTEAITAKIEYTEIRFVSLIWLEVKRSEKVE